MTDLTRRDVLRVAGVVVASGVVAACTSPPPSPSPSEPSGERLQVSTVDGLAVLEARAGRTVVAAADALASADRSRLVSVSPDAGGTRLTTRDALTATVLAAARLRGRLSPRAVSVDVQLVALVDDASAGHGRYRPAGRTETTVVVAGASGERARHTVPGCVEPEAFSMSGGELFVLDYVPPAAPDRYRVRVMDIANGTVGPLSTRLKTVVPPSAEEEMRGEGRQAVYDPARGLLFTLYTHQPGDGMTNAFVHTLSVREGWAYCVDLPAPFGEGPAAAHAIVRSTYGTGVLVVDASGGAIARLDPAQLIVDRVARFTGTATAASACLSTDNERLFVAADRRVVVVDAASLKETTSWRLPDQACGVAATATNVYIGQPGAVLAVDPSSGVIRSRIKVAGLSQVQHAVAVDR
jgi:hypothetical protein